MDSLKNNTPSMASVIQQAVLNKLKDVHTSMPGIIVSFNSTKQTAEVQPAIKRIFYTGEENKKILTPANLPVLINVPLFFPQGGGFSLTFPVTAGDECQLQFSERDIDTWYKKGGTQPPNSFRQHSLSDAVCFVGISSEPNVISGFSSTDVELRDAAGTTKITIKPGSKITIDAVAQLDVTAPVSNWTGDINVTGNIVQVGNMTRTGLLGNTGAVTIAGPIVAAPGPGGGGAQLEGILEVDGDVDVTGNLLTDTDLIVNGLLSFNLHKHGGVSTGSGQTSTPI